MSDENNPERDAVEAIRAGVAGEPDDHELWDKAVTALEAFDGGLNRNSSDVAIQAFRDVYDRFLAKFPLYYGYWKRYAEKEFSISGTEGAELVWYRALAAIPNSAELWGYFCDFKVTTCHDFDQIREMPLAAGCCYGNESFSIAQDDDELDYL